MIHIYYGNGKGKTCAAVGCAIRAAGQNLNVLFIQFLKSEGSGERNILKQLQNVTVTEIPSNCKFICNMNTDEKNFAKSTCHQLLSTAINCNGKYDLIILDEVFSAFDAGFISKDEIMTFIKSSTNTEIILTGHNIDNDILQLGDYVTKLSKISHPYDKGICARKGIEY